MLSSANAQANVQATVNNNDLNQKQAADTKITVEAQAPFLKPLTLKGHTSFVYCVALSSNGRFGLSGSYDYTLRLWDLKTGESLLELEGHTDWVRSVALSGDARFGLSGSYDKTLRLWNLKTGKSLLELEGHTSYVNSVALSGDGRFGLSGSDDKTLRLWDLKIGECLRELKGHTEYVLSVALSGDGRFGLSGSSDGTLRLWDLKTGESLLELKGHTSPVCCVALSGDARFGLSGSYDYTLRLWDLKTGESLLELEGHTDTVSSVAISLDGHFGLSGSHDKTLRLWNLKTGVCAEVFNQQSLVWSCSTLTQKNQLYFLAGLYDGTVIFRHACAIPEDPALKAQREAEQLMQKQKEVEAAAQKAVEIASTANEKTKQEALERAVKAELAAKAKEEEFETLKRKLAEQDALHKKEQEDARKINEEAKKTIEALKLKSKEVEEKTSKEKTLTSPITPKTCIIHYSELTFEKELGQGAYGTVHLGKWRHGPVAIKQLLLSNPSENSVKEFESEGEVMAKLRSPYVVQFYGCSFTPKYCLVMEYMPKGSLYSLLHSSAPIDWDLRFRVAKEIAGGLAFLHAENILHRDIKSLNVLLDDAHHAKLTDFGLAKVKTESKSISTKSSGGTLGWMAPELFKMRPSFTKQSDVYSLGMTLYEIASRKIPFEEAADPKLIPTFVEKGEREDIPADCPPKLATLITYCWHQQPDKRPTASEIVEYLESSVPTYSPVTAAMNTNVSAVVTAKK